MKSIVMIITFILAFGPIANAENRAINKVTRGVTNVISSPIEVPKQARAYWVEGAQKTDHILVWIGTGTIWGIVQGVKRAGSGLWDVLTFSVEEYDSLMKPDYVFQEWPRNPVSGR